MSFHPTVMACGRFDAEGKVFAAMRKHDIISERIAAPEAGKPFLVQLGGIDVSSIANEVEELIGIDAMSPCDNFAEPERVVAKATEIREALEHHNPDCAECIVAMAEVGARISLIH